MSKKTEGKGRGKKEIRKLAVGYIRVSTVGQSVKGISLEAQRAGIEKFAEAAGYMLIEVFEDVGSGVGAKSFRDRNGLRTALNLVAREDAVLVVWDWDRLSRHAGFDKQVAKVLPDNDQIKCAREGNTMREASRAAVFAHGEQIAKKTSRNTRKGMAKKHAAGAVFGNPAITTEVQPRGVVAWSNAADVLVRRIADVLRDLDDPFEVTYAQIAAILNGEGLLTLHNKEWTVSRAREPVTKARELLRNEEKDALRLLPTFGMV